MRRFRISHYPLVLCGLLAGGVPIIAQAADLLTLSVDSEKGYRASQDPLVIRFGKDMPADLVPYLRLEIDAIDVTDFVERTDQALVYTPQVPLEAGPHELRVVAVLPDGAIEEAALWSIEVRASQAFRVAEFNSQLDLQAMQRVSDDLTNPPADKTTGQGAFALASRHADGGWTTTTQANMLYNSQQQQNLTGKEFDLSDYQVATTWTQSAVVLGHQTLSPNSMILNEFSRRGLSATYHSEQQRFSATGFSTRTEEITGFDNFTGVEDPHHRTSGVMLSAYPFASNPQWLAVSAIYLDGRGNRQGAAQIGDTTQSSGDAQAIVLDSYLGDRLWRLRGEYASSSNDFDGENTGFDARDDDAYSVSIGYDSSRDQNPDGLTTSTWGVSVIHQRVGPWFYSLGNNSVTADRETMQFLGNYQGEQFGATASISLGEDNVENDTSLPTTEIDAALINLTYVPRQDNNAADNGQQGGGIFSNPSFNLGWSHNSLDQIRAPSGFTGDDVNSRYDEISLMANFAGSDWYWSLNYSLITQEDEINPDNRTDTSTTGLDSQFMLNEHFSMAPQLQQSVTDYVNTGLESESWLAGLTLNLNYPADWNYSLSYTVNRERVSDDSLNNRTSIGQLAVQWKVRHAKPNQFGTSIFTTASYMKNEVGADETDQYQVFLGVNVSWPVSL